MEGGKRNGESLLEINLPSLLESLNESVSSGNFEGAFRLLFALPIILNTIRPSDFSSSDQSSNLFQRHERFDKPADFKVILNPPNFPNVESRSENRQFGYNSSYTIPLGSALSYFDLDFFISRRIFTTA